MTQALTEESATPATNATPPSKAAMANVQQRERISAVNNWRGQCLDNFAPEHAILRCSERLLALDQPCVFKLEETAGNRTRTLGRSLLDTWPKQPESKRLASLLDQWSIREKERNELVHGRFTIRAGCDSAWLLINETSSVKKGIVIAGRSMLDSRQADAFLKQVIAERKQLEEALEVFEGIVAP